MRRGSTAPDASRFLPVEGAIVARSRIRSVLWRFGRALPRRWGVPLLNRLALPRRATHHHTDVAVPAPFRLDVYVLTDRHGDRGPAASLWLGREEVLRLDCLSRRPHLHYGLGESRWLGASGTSIQLPATTTDEAVQRVGFELATNLPWALATSYRRSHRRLAATLDRDAFARAADEMVRVMRRLQQTVDA